jgi:hypothetical protein
MIRLTVASGVGSPVASRRPAASIRPVQWGCKHMQGQRQAPKAVSPARLSRYMSRKRHHMCAPIPHLGSCWREA